MDTCSCQSVRPVTAGAAELRVLFAGRKLAGCEALSWTHQQGHIIAGVLTDDFLPGSPCAEWARVHGVPLYTYEAAEQAVQDGSLEFDLGVSFVYWRKLRPALFEHPTRGFINFHPAPLPSLKGVAGYNIAILEGMSEYGVTAHYVDECIDTGPIIEVATVDMDSTHETAQSLESHSMKAMLALYRKTVQRVAASHALLPTSKNQGGRYFTRDEMEALKQVQPDDDADRKARAFWFPPYDGAYLEHRGARFTIVPRHVLESLGGADTHLKLREPA